MGSKKKLWMTLPVLVVLLTTSLTVQGGVVWQDTFDDSSSLDNYDIVNGDLISDGVLTSLGCENSDCVFGSTYFYRNSLGATGTWSFDFNLTSILYFYFIGIGKVSGHGLFPKQGYNLNIRPSQKTYTLDYISTSISTLGSYTSEKSIVGWKHIDITRDENGEIIVYLDGKTIIEIKQADLTSSDHINIQLSKGSQLDNLVYSNTIDEPTERSNNDKSPVLLSFVFSGFLLLVYIYRLKR